MSDAIRNPERSPKLWAIQFSNGWRYTCDPTSVEDAEARDLPVVEYVPSATARRVSEVGDLAERLHDDAAGWDPRGEHGQTVDSIMGAFSRKLTVLNDRHVGMGLSVLSLMDPLDIAAHIDRLAGHLRLGSLNPDTVDALGAQCIALRFAIARVETLDITSGSDTA